MQSLSISICSDDRKVLEIFKSAINKNIKILIPNYLLKSRHLILGRKRMKRYLAILPPRP